MSPVASTNGKHCQPPSDEDQLTSLGGVSAMAGEIGLSMSLSLKREGMINV